MEIKEAIRDIKENIKPSIGWKALDVAITALEKQIPKKPEDIRYFRTFNSYAGLCPVCGCGANSEFQYCGDCGQKLDWESKV